MTLGRVRIKVTFQESRLPFKGTLSTFNHHYSPVEWEQVERFYKNKLCFFSSAHFFCFVSSESPLSCLATPAVCHFVARRLATHDVRSFPHTIYVALGAALHPRGEHFRWSWFARTLRRVRSGFRRQRSVHSRHSHRRGGRHIRPLERHTCFIHGNRTDLSRETKRRRGCVARHVRPRE